MNRRIALVLVLATSMIWSCKSEEPANNGPGEDVSTETDADTGGPSPDTDSGGEVCHDPDGDGFGDGCAAGTDCVPDDANSYPGAVKLCDDGLDNDCDGQSDEDCPCVNGTAQNCYSGPAGTEGVGICNVGHRVCEGGVWGSCTDEIGPGNEICDGVDNDCDGNTDEGVTNACGLCGDVPVEVCGDALDNDCNGLVDEPDAGCFCDGRTNQPCYTGAPVTLGVGICRGGVIDCECPGGAQFCEDGVWGACRGQVTPEVEICDGLDNDCDGDVDEGLRNACGDCGTEVDAEICDALDNDCDGAVDEGVRLTCGLCPGEVGEEECGDGFDNDCNGIVDDGCSCSIGEPTCYPGPPEVVGIGVCVAGSRMCDASGEFWTPCAGFVLPSIELCDGLDNNCDGEVDIGTNGCSVCETGIEVCDNIDNDCDGLTDEGVRNSCGQCYEDVVPEETLGQDGCNGIDDDCDGLTDETLVNACGNCDESCYLEDYNNPDDWLEGGFEGIDEDVSSGLRLGTQRWTFPDLWIANTTDRTVSRFNTATGALVGTYPVGADPSRTAVDLDGNCWVGNRSFGVQGTVSYIHANDCTGDECVAFTIDVGGVDDLPRGLAVDAENYAWVGTYNGRQLHRVSNSGVVTETYDIGLAVYGLAIDSEGIIWISGRGNNALGAFDIETRTLIGSWTVPDCASLYGIAVDGEGNVWLGNYSCSNLVRFDRASFEAGTPRFDAFSNPALEYTRGVAVDGEGYIWVAASNSDRLGKFDPRTNTWVGTWPTCDSPIGVGIAPDGNVWTACYNSNNATQHAPDGTSLQSVNAGRNPYSYSDLTGFQLRNFTAPSGTWRTQFDCGFDNCTFDMATWAATLPAGTQVSVRARVSADRTTWTPWTMQFTASPAEFGDALPRARYLELEVILTTTDPEVTPVVSSIEVFWQRP